MAFIPSCGGKEPTQNDVIGLWKSSDGPNFEFSKDGFFTAKSFLAEAMFHLDSQFTNVRFDGGGKWVLRKGNTTGRYTVVSFCMEGRRRGRTI